MQEVLYLILRRILLHDVMMTDHSLQTHLTQAKLKEERERSSELMQQLSEER